MHPYPDIRFFLEIGFWVLIVAGIANGERLSRKYAREFYEKEQRGRDDD